MPENSGIQNFGSFVNAPQAAGAHAHAEQVVNPSPETAALAQAVEELRAQLARLLAEQPDGVPDADARKAEIALRDLAKTALQPTPDHGVLKGRVRTIVEVLGEASSLTTALTVLETAVRRLIGLP